jgi:uncharacterized protein YkwD
MNRKHIAAVLCLILVFTAAVSALAASTPTSQFYFSGWYIVNTPPCKTQATPAPQGSVAGSGNNASTATKAPSVPGGYVIVDSSNNAPCHKANAGKATATPTVKPTAAPTAKPSTAPTAQPTAAPTAKPTVKPTVKPTAAPTAPANYTPDSVSAQEQLAANLLNQDRGANGLSAITLDPELCRIARIKSTDMFTNNYFAHESPTLGNAGDLLKSNGYKYSGWGENIAHHANATKAQAAFMSSEGHRHNILGSQWTKFGIGICFDASGFIYETQIFVR